MSSAAPHEQVRIHLAPMSGAGPVLYPADRIHVTVAGVRVAGIEHVELSVDPGDIVRCTLRCQAIIEVDTPDA